MPSVRIAVPHGGDADAAVEKVRGVLERAVEEFQGRDLQSEWTGRSATLKFTSLGFQIGAKVDVDATQVIVEIDLPMAAMMFKGRVEDFLKKNLIEVLGSSGSS
jgi:hypothetical protein